MGYVLAYGRTWYQRALPCQLRGSPPRTHNNRAAVRDNCGQRKRGFTCCLIDRVTAASKTEGVPAISSIESIMIRRPFGSIDPNSIRETELHKESAGRPQYGTRYQNFHLIFRRMLFLTLARYVCATPGTYTNIFFLILRLMSYTDACFFSRLPDTPLYAPAININTSIHHLQLGIEVEVVCLFLP